MLGEFMLRMIPQPSGSWEFQTDGAGAFAWMACVLREGTIYNGWSTTEDSLITFREPRHQRPELPKPWLPLAPPASSVDSVTGPVSTGVGTNCAILSPDRIS